MRDVIFLDQHSFDMPDGDGQIRRVLEKRYSVLKQLAERPARKPELVSSLTGSRSTIDRSIDDLLEIGCVQKEEAQYSATPAGRLALQKHEEYRRATDAVELTSNFLNHLPEKSSISTELLDGASVTMGADHAPDRALASSIDLFDRATRMRGLAPVILSFYPSHIANQLATSDLTVEIVASTDVIDTLPSMPEWGEISLSEAEGLSLFEAREELPYALWLMDTPDSVYAGITAYDSGGVAGVLINDSQPAVEWAEAQYEQYLAVAGETTISHS